MPNEGDIEVIDNYFSKVFLSGKWYKCKKVWQRVQGELEQFHDLIILDNIEEDLV